MRLLRLLHHPCLVVLALGATCVPTRGGAQTGTPPAQAAVPAAPSASAAADAPVLPAFPAALDRQVRARVAALWQVDADEVAIQVPLVPDGLPADSADVTLLGSGSGGWWVVKAAWKTGATCAVRVRAGVHTTALVATRAIARGEVLADADMVPRDTVRWGEPHPGDAQPRAGWVARRLVRAGEALVRPTVEPPLAVVSGRPVALMWKSGAIELRVQGRASESAPLGAEVLVRTQNGRRLRGVVVAKDVVDVTPGAASGAAIGPMGPMGGYDR